ncbi:hypothetical protein H5S09_05325 [Limosilactobacillus sp. STM2_1]|uniref:Uncharacterized protein n=1 Tax=Limosilactobacillus rudii TaxID=2759755 RepID=A0A7W3UM29_9LACO|nr:hypothetical protein [Limosilactobacillus rudii]MBB1079266.1 hypothetical protein [Limosilactobacillus rudii]MBB1097355.1 hypothetical protein [Limosilactobacillus rudii]MCD7134464.1 hypothetical protein [Limosilactobacillus rudii]
MTTMNDLFKAMSKQAAENRQANGIMLIPKNDAPAGIGQGILNVRK